jgi:hypothetical protein
VSLASAVRTRFVRAEPPHEPEPHPDEPFAPVYDFVPLDRPLPGGWLTAMQLPAPRWPDAAAFGPPGSGELQAIPMPDSFDFRPHRHCGCGAGWRGDEACWNCGRAAT